MNQFQLPLIEALGPSTPPPADTFARRKALNVSSNEHRAALQRLLQGPAPLVQVARIAGALDGEGLVDELRELGLDVQTVMVPSPVEGSAATAMVMVCCLTKRDIRKVLQHVKKQEHKND